MHYWKQHGYGQEALEKRDSLDTPPSPLNNTPTRAPLQDHSSLLAQNRKHETRQNPFEVSVRLTRAGQWSGVHNVDIGVCISALWFTHDRPVKSHGEACPRFRSNQAVARLQD